MKLGPAARKRNPCLYSLHSFRSEFYAGLCCKHFLTIHFLTILSRDFFLRMPCIIQAQQCYTPDAGKSRRRRRLETLDDASESSTGNTDGQRQSFTFKLGFEYENASDGSRWMADPAEVLLARSTLDDWPGIPLFVPDRLARGTY